MHGSRAPGAVGRLAGIFVHWLSSQPLIDALGSSPVPTYHVSRPMEPVVNAAAELGKGIIVV